MKKTILIIAAHPDDELLGVGGTALKHVNLGDEVFSLVLGEGISSRDNFDKKEIDVLHNQLKQAAKIMGFKDVFLLNFPDNKLDGVLLLDIVKKIEQFIEKIKPNIIYTHHGGDLNVDHQIAYQAVLTACRPCNVHCPQEIYSFETPSSTEWQLENSKLFAPNMFVDIGAEIDTKIKAFKCYKSEIRRCPHPRSEEGIKILASYRGLQSNLRYAEAFRLERSIR